MGLKSHYSACANLPHICSLAFLSIAFLPVSNAAALPALGAEQVIASVECRVRDAGTLKNYLGISRGSILRIETLTTYVSSLIIDGDTLITGFPAVLNFNSRRRQFSFAGSSDADGESTVTLQVQGTLGSRGDATILFNLQDDRVDDTATASLTACKRIQ